MRHSPLCPSSSKLGTTARTRHRGPALLTKVRSRPENASLEESVDIPTLTTERLILRPFRTSDLDALAAMNADPRVMQFIGEVQDRTTAFRTMCAYMGHWYLRRYGPWAVEERATGVFVGRAGLTR